MAIAQAAPSRERIHQPLRASAILTCVLLTSCATYGRPLAEIAPEVNATLYTGPTLVEPGDVLELRFPRKEPWDQAARVRQDGRVSFPVIGEVQVAGSSVADLKRMLDERYGRILELPDVTINIGRPAQETGAVAGGIVVSGEVARPGMIASQGERLTLIDALGRAGGHLKRTALLSNTLLLRRSPQTGRYAGWRIDAREVHWQSAEPIYLQRHDLIYVPNKPIDNVNIWVDQYITRMIPTDLAAFGLGIVVGHQ